MKSACSWGGAGPCPWCLPLETTGGPCSANSAAPKGCMGQGMGSMPMSTDAQPVPLDVARVLCATAQGIVTRMGQDRNGLGGEAIESGPEGMRPDSVAVASACAPCGACAVAAPAACKRSAAAGAATALHTPPSNTGVNKTRGGYGE